MDRVHVQNFYISLINVFHLTLAISLRYSPWVEIYEEYGSFNGNDHQNLVTRIYGNVKLCIQDISNQLKTKIIENQIGNCR